MNINKKQKQKQEELNSKLMLVYIMTNSKLIITSRAASIFTSVCSDIATDSVTSCEVTFES